MGARMAGIGAALMLTAAMLSAGIDTAAVTRAEPATQSPNDTAEPDAGRSPRVPPDEQSYGVTQGAYDAYYALKEQKKFRFLVLKITGATLTEVAVEKTSSSTEYDDFIEAIQAGGEEECRYGVYDFQFERDGKQHRKIFLILWAPDDATAKQKKLYTAGRAAVVRNLRGVTLHSARDLGDLSYTALLEKARENP